MDCNAEYAWLKSTFENNDAGFSHAVLIKGQQAYQDHNTVTLKKIENLSQPQACHKVLRDWLAFFRKGHIGLSLNANQASSPSTTPAISAEPFDLASFKKRTASADPEDLLGIWQFSGYTVALDKSEGGYTGFILESSNPSWKPNHIKLHLKQKDRKLTAIYYMGDRSANAIDDVKRLGNNAIILDGGFVTMRRLDPKTPDTPEIDRYVRLSAAGTPSFEKLSEHTVLIRIPTFNHSQKNDIENLIKAHYQTITDTHNLIIDLRGNGGGSDISYKPLIPILYTNPIRTVGMEMLSTPLNNQRMSDFVTDPDFPAELKTWAKESLVVLKENEGKFINLDKDKVEIETLDNILPKPVNVAILIDGGNGSTSEQFLLAAKQSNKVKLFGTTTAGVLDISNMYRVNSPSGQLTLHYSLSRSYRIPDMAIDGKGIQPDYFIDSSIPQYQWIDFTQKLLEGMSTGR